MRRPLGVFFSLALLILIGSAFIGFFAATGMARAQHYARSRKLQSVAPQEARFEALTTALYKIQAHRLLASFPEKQKEMLQAAVDELEHLRSRPDLEEIRPVTEVELAAAYANLAWLAENDGNSSEAARYIKLGQDLLRGAGWRDYSEDALRAVAKRERNRWNPGDKTAEGTRK